MGTDFFERLKNVFIYEDNNSELLFSFGITNFVSDYKIYALNAISQWG